MRASEARKSERNSPFERGVAKTGRQDREPSTDVRKPLGNPPSTLNHTADWRQSGSSSPGQWSGHLNEASAAVAAARMTTAHDDRQTLPPPTPGLQGGRCNRPVLMLHR